MGVQFDVDIVDLAGVLDLYDAPPVHEMKRRNQKAINEHGMKWRNHEVPCGKVISKCALMNEDRQDIAVSMRKNRIV